VHFCDNGINVQTIPAKEVAHEMMTNTMATKSKK